MKTGIELIADERARQVSVEGWTPEGDSEHCNNEMLTAAAVYMSDASDFANGLEDIAWPWHPSWHKPGQPVDKLRCLAKAGALIAAEMDRLQSSENTPGQAAAKPLPALGGSQASE